MWTRARFVVLVCASVTLTSCLVHSMCLSDSDCAGNERCGADGECDLECRGDATDACPEARPVCLVEANRCVACLEAEHCGDGGRCVSWVCVPELAQDFTLVDRNPRSRSFGQAISLGDHLGEVVLVFFAGLG